MSATGWSGGPTGDGWGAPAPAALGNDPRKGGGKAAPRVSTGADMTRAQEKAVGLLDLHGGNLLSAVLASGGNKAACREAAGRIAAAVQAAKTAALTAEG